MNSSRQEQSTVFIDNLQDSTTLGTLWKAFHSFGRIVNVHRPSKRRLVSNTRYAFISFESYQQAAVAIKETNGLCIDGGRISTQFARPLRSRIQKQCWVQSVVSKPPSVAEEDEIWPKLPEHQTTPVTAQSVDTDSGGPIKLYPSEFLIPRLERSILVRTRKRTTVVELGECLNASEEVEHIICKSPVEFLVIFRHERHKAIFLECKKWAQEEWTVDACCEDQPQQSRIANIAIHGIPPQAWCEASAKVVAERFGSVIEFETNFEIPPVNLEIFLTIKSNTFKIINDEVEIIFDGKVAVVGIVEFWADDLSRCYGASVVESSDGIKVVPPASPEVPVNVGMGDTSERDGLDCSSNPLGIDVLCPGGGGLMVVSGAESKANYTCTFGLGGSSLSIQIGNQKWQFLSQLRTKILKNWSLLGYYFLEWRKAALEGQKMNRFEEISKELSFATPSGKGGYYSETCLFEEQQTPGQPIYKENDDYSLVTSQSCVAKDYKSDCLSIVDCNENSEDQSFGLGLLFSPNGGLPTPVDSSQLDEVKLQVVISSDGSKSQNSKQPLRRSKRNNQRNY